MKIKIVLLGLIICTQIQAQNSERRIMGKDYAEKHLMLALKNNADRTKMNEKLIPKKAGAIKYAELILFEKYKKENIEFQKPYQVYLIDDYWVIFGTLPKNYKGGVFSIVFDSWNGKIMRLTHSK
ncbi:NTF2 fold immunity protein [uncultured Aquimarina sp.]|uniref:NTF2 fold immunity protein n=1 Tax=uncultured Aquimarina sp. TaxID=575652 RepID=UPI002637B618|nr:NTF2 fold immunity protein [uncultured Aquimarina sp.]